MLVKVKHPAQPQLPAKKTPVTSRAKKKTVQGKKPVAKGVATPGKSVPTTTSATQPVVTQHPRDGGSAVQSSDTVAKDSDATATEPSPVVMDLMTTNDDQSQTAAKPDGENGETIATATVHAATVAGSAPVTSASVPVARPVSVKGEDKLFNFSPVTQEILKALEAAVHQHRLGRQAEEQRQDQGEKDKPPSDKKSSKNKLQPEKSQTDKKPPTKPAKKTTTQTEGAKKPPSGSGQPKKNQGKTQVYGGRGRRRDHSSPEKRDSSRHRSSRAASEEEEQGPPTSRHGDSSRSSSGSCRSNRQDGSPAKKKGRKEEEERSKGHRHHSRTSQSSRSESRDQEAAESKGFGYVVDEFTSDVNPSDANPIDLDQFNMDEFVTVDEVEGDEADNANPPESSSSSPNPPEPSTSSPNTQDGTYGRSERSSKRKRGTPDTPISTMKSSQEKERPLSKSTPTPSSSTSTPPGQKTPRQAATAKRTQVAKPQPPTTSGRKTRSSAAAAVVATEAAETRETDDDPAVGMEPEPLPVELLSQPMGEAAAAQLVEEVVVTKGSDMEGMLSSSDHKVSVLGTALPANKETDSAGSEIDMETKAEQPPEVDGSEGKAQAKKGDSILGSKAQNEGCTLELGLTDPSSTAKEQDRHTTLELQGLETVSGHQVPQSLVDKVPKENVGLQIPNKTVVPAASESTGSQELQTTLEEHQDEEESAFHILDSVEDQVTMTEALENHSPESKGTSKQQASYKKVKGHIQKKDGKKVVQTPEKIQTPPWSRRG
ncbi:uncharacterized protein LOC135515536 [Oncorhynchus masou masou]|uniref:uncharacterized protein LOC135515536 n=1 Tax=Oncorhynchus masou masou TaxID=90313 RepID=UPI00318461D5